MKTVIIFTDGGSLGNPGPGGYGVVILEGKKKKELSGGYKLTTNNRMELLAAIKGLQALRDPTDVTLYTDSRYLVDAINQEWVFRWRANRWMRSRKEKALNIDLWKKLLPLCEKHNVTFKWVKGHSGHPENERCDRLARQAAKGDNLLSDTGYNPDKKQASFFE